MYRRKILDFITATGSIPEFEYDDPSIIPGPITFQSTLPDNSASTVSDLTAANVIDHKGVANQYDVTNADPPVALHIDSIAVLIDSTAITDATLVYQLLANAYLRRKGADVSERVVPLGDKLLRAVSALTEGNAAATEMNVVGHGYSRFKLDNALKVNLKTHTFELGTFNAVNTGGTATPITLFCYGFAYSSEDYVTGRQGRKRGNVQAFRGLRERFFATRHAG